MKDITTTPTADLIAEWGKYPDTLSKNRPTWAKNRRAAIATELDMRADELGLFIVGGCFVYAKCVNGDGPYRNWYGVVNPAEWVRITAKEQHDLEGWLLLKEGGRGA